MWIRTFDLLVENTCLNELIYPQVATPHDNFIQTSQTLTIRVDNIKYVFLSKLEIGKENHLNFQVLRFVISCMVEL